MEEVGPYEGRAWMASQPSMQEIVQQHRRAAFVGRNAERALFQRNFDIPLDDPRHRFRFHVHGNAGVGKSFLVRELEHLARERGALTAYVDESAGSLPEALTAVCRQFAVQGRKLKDLERLLATYRERRHEAEAAALAVLDPESQEPLAGSTALVRMGLATVSATVPGAGPFTNVVDEARLARGADRLRAGLSARFRNHEDVELVMSPETVLTPVLLRELRDAASAVPWIVLFFDTYERTGPFLDQWLHKVVTREEPHGKLPATVVVVTAGQRPLDAARWGGFADAVADVPLGPFTEAEARRLLAGKDVVAEPVVEEVLRLTGCLPVLVSTLAETRPGDPDDIGDPSATAVDRFLKWEQDPVRRAAALAGSLPRRLDADVFRALVDGSDDEVDALYGWLTGLPFVSERGDGVQYGEGLRYHDVVRAPMLRLQRRRSPRGWARTQRRLAEVFAQWRSEAEAGRDVEEVWADEEWRELRLAESYHSLCAGERAALPEVLRDFVRAAADGDVTAGRWARTLTDAGRDAGARTAQRWGGELTRALGEGGTAAALGAVLRRAGLDERTQALGHAVQGSALRDAGAHEEALAAYDRAVALDPGLARAYRSRAILHARQGDHNRAITDMDRALALSPDDARSHAARGEYHRILGHHDRALADLDHSIRLDPAHHFAWASRGATRLARGELDEALADLNQALELRPEYVWALVRRARAWRALGDPTRQLADLDRALALDPDWAWTRCERGDALRAAGRDEEALTDYDRALALDPEYASAYASRGASLSRLGRHEEALTDLNRALQLRPTYTWALTQRATLLATRPLPAPER